MSRLMAVMAAACVTTEARTFMGVLRVGMRTFQSSLEPAAAPSGAIRENAVMQSTASATAAQPSQRTLELAQQLVRINTVSDRSNLDLIHLIRDELARLGVKSRLTNDSTRTKANLFATLGEGKPAGVILSGHTDTVPWDGQAWTHEPLGVFVVV